MALARQILTRYKSLDDAGRHQFFRFLAETITPDTDKVMNAARGFVQAPGPDTLKRLTQLTEPPRLEYLRRLNLAPGATSEIVAMRKDLLRFLKGDDGLAAVDRDFVSQLDFLVQSRFSGAAAHRLVDARQYSGENHPLRGGARNPGLGRSSPPSRPGGPALLRLFPSLRSWMSR